MTRVIASTVAALPSSTVERFGERTAARYKVGGEWQERTYGEVGEAIDELALGLIDLGVELGDRVCILADTRLEWTVASFAISAAGATWSRSTRPTRRRECDWVPATRARRWCSSRTRASWQDR